MKILYSSVHSVLEFDELTTLLELNVVYPDKKLDIEIFSLGAYTNPTQNADYLRLPISKGRFYPDLYAVAMQCSNELIHDELIDWCDIWLCMHNASLPGQKKRQQWLANNFNKFQAKKKKIVFRSIGQSTPEIERELKEYRSRGMIIVRMSPLERQIMGYGGDDAIIRFSKDSEEFSGWTGEKKLVITLAQSFMKRGDHLLYNIYEKVTNGFNRKVYGTENENLGEVNGGRPSYEELKRILKESRVFFYTGTIPSPYTLSLIEAMMMGVPVVAIGPKLRQSGESPYRWPHYELPQIISNGINGYISDNLDDLRGYIRLLLDNDDVAKRIGEAGRKTAIELFDRKKIMSEWVEFLTKI